MGFTNKHRVHPAIAVWLASDDYDGINEDNALSVTTLIRPLKQIILSTRVENTGHQGDLMNQLASRYGTAMHDALEKAWLSKNVVQAMKDAGLPPGIHKILRVNPEDHDEDYFNVYLEKRVEKLFDGFLINGKYDMIMDGEVNDYKTTGTYTYTHGTMDDKYILQGSLYRWLNPTIATSDQLTIHFIFTDWSKLESLKNPSAYPKHRIVSKQYALMSVAETESWLRKKISEIRMYMHEEEDVIPRCTDEELWRGKPVYKYYKNPNNLTRSTANFDSPDGAYRRLAEDGNVGLVKPIYGKVKACRYCPALSVCQQARSYIADGSLTLED